MEAGGQGNNPVPEVIMENVNRNHKDSVFTFLFGNPDTLRELYSAIEGVTFPPDTPININTLSDVLFRKQRNDISFLIDNRLIILIEHQSTINENVPLRFLMYIGRLYEEITDLKRRFQKRLVKIPRPEFIVLYNGTDEYPDYKELRLSDAFTDIDMTKIDLPLELVVQIYNINKGHNQDILSKSNTLGGYSIFIDKIREFEKEKKSLEKAFTCAINYCIDNNILRDFLRKHGSEVINMLTAEYDPEVEKAVVREETREEARQYFLALLNQGLTIEEIKERLQQKEEFFSFS
jgi:hypothetical protein